MAAPKVLRVVLEEHGVELFAEAVDVEVFQRLLLAFEERGAEVAASCDERRPEAHVRKRLGLERDGVVEELVVEEDARDAVAAEHDAVGLLRIGAILGEGAVAAERLVVERRRTLAGEHAIPPDVDLGNLREESMAAHVHAVAVVDNGAGDAAERMRFLQNDNVPLLRAGE